MSLPWQPQEQLLETAREGLLQSTPSRPGVNSQVDRKGRKPTEACELCHSVSVLDYLKGVLARGLGVGVREWERLERWEGWRITDGELCGDPGGSAEITARLPEGSCLPQQSSEQPGGEE